MIRRLLLALCFCLGVIAPAQAAFSLVANVGAGGNPITTGAINTTGADLIVVTVSWFNGTPGSLSDSKSNTWTQIGTDQTSPSVTQSTVSMFYVSAPTVGSGHTFTATQSFSAITVEAWSGSAASPLDQTSQAGANAAGSVTPTQANELVVAGICAPNTNNVSSINGGFTISDNIAWSSGVSEGGASAYLVQTSAAAANPTWTLDGNTGASIIATFKAAAGAAACKPTRALMGVGC